MIVQTVVFEFETQEQRQATLGKFNDMLFAGNAPRVTGLSVDDELRRAQWAIFVTQHSDKLRRLLSLKRFGVVMERTDICFDFRWVVYPHSPNIQ